MSYNKALAEKQWCAWKETEEKKLRKLGVDEDIIQRLHTYDWEEFKRERRYQDWLNKGMPGIEPLYSKPDIDIPIRDGESLLDSIEDPKLYRLLSKTDKLTLQILLYKIQGFTSIDISKLTGLKENTVRQRISRLKKLF